MGKSIIDYPGGPNDVVINVLIKKRHKEMLLQKKAKGDTLQKKKKEA